MLTFNLKKQWFDKIKSGEKTHEHRECKPYWDKRLKPYINQFIVNKFFTKQIMGEPLTIPCYFKLGYPKPTATDKILYGKVKSIKIINGKNTDLAVDKDVYDIEFELI